MVLGRVEERSSSGVQQVTLNVRVGHLDLPPPSDLKWSRIRCRQSMARNSPIEATISPITGDADLGLLSSVRDDGKKPINVCIVQVRVFALTLLQMNVCFFDTVITLDIFLQTMLDSWLLRSFVLHQAGNLVDFCPVAAIRPSPSSCSRGQRTRPVVCEVIRRVSVLPVALQHRHEPPFVLAPATELDLGL